MSSILPSKNVFFQPFGRHHLFLQVLETAILHWPLIISLILRRLSFLKFCSPFLTTKWYGFISFKFNIHRPPRGSCDNVLNCLHQRPSFTSALKICTQIVFWCYWLSWNDVFSSNKMELDAISLDFLKYNILNPPANLLINSGKTYVFNYYTILFYYYNLQYILFCMCIYFFYFFIY